MTKFYLIRHGEKDADDQLIVGRTPGIHLTPRGRAHGESIARHLAATEIKHVLCSPRERAIETAEPLARIHKTSVDVSPALEELHFGEWTGKSLTELEQIPGWRQFNSFRSTGRPPGGETMLDVQSRFVGEMLRLRAAYPHDEIALVSHGDPIRAALNYFIGAPLDLFHRIEISIGSVSVITLTEFDVRILRVNEVPEQ
ncbi:MAG: histidine phosphatase family protein [Opitutus sp.]